MSRKSYKIVLLGYGKNHVYYKLSKFLDACCSIGERFGLGFDLASNITKRIIQRLITRNRLLFCSERHTSNSRSYGEFDFDGKIKSTIFKHTGLLNTSGYWSMTITFMLKAKIIKTLNCRILMKHALDFVSNRAPNIMLCRGCVDRTGFTIKRSYYSNNMGLCDMFRCTYSANYLCSVYD